MCLPPVEEAVINLKKRMEDEKFIIGDDLAVILYLALEMKKPLLIEGRVGVGKTDVANVLARSLKKSVTRLQCYEGLDRYDAIYEWDYLRQMQRIRIESISSDASKEDLEAKIFSEEYLLKRPLLQALFNSEQTVLLIDEVDRADEEFEAFLLEFLSDFQISIPEMGTIRAKEKPIVILTSNRSREIGDALKRRCFYVYIEYPDCEKEFKIIKMKVPEANDTLARQVCKFAQRIRKMKFLRTPGTAEILDWTRALVIFGAEALSVENVKKTAGCLFKDKEDLQELEKNIKTLLDEILEEDEKHLPAPPMESDIREDEDKTEKTQDKKLPGPKETQIVYMNNEELEKRNLPKAYKATYSREELNANIVTRNFQKNELYILKRLTTKFARKVSTKEGRRFTVYTRKGEMNLRQIMRTLIRGRGEIAEIPRKKHKILKSKLVVLCDVSGSMTEYHQFILQFLFTLQNTVKNSETFLFSTHLTRITESLKNREFYYAVETILRLARDYGGGTRIGQAIMAFFKYYGHIVNKKSVVIIVSDGWDTGDIDLLSEEMMRLKRMTKRIIWLNPLLSLPDYTPICMGMRTCLPFIDVFASVCSAGSLQEFISRLDPAIFHTSRFLDKPFIIRPVKSTCQTISVNMYPQLNKLS